MIQNSLTNGYKSRAQEHIFHKHIRSFTKFGNTTFVILDVHRIAHQAALLLFLALKLPDRYSLICVRYFNLIMRGVGTCYMCIRTDNVKRVTSISPHRLQKMTRLKTAAFAASASLAIFWLRSR